MPPIDFRFAIGDRVEIVATGVPGTVSAVLATSTARQYYIGHPPYGESPFSLVYHWYDEDDLTALVTLGEEATP